MFIGLRAATVWETEWRVTSVRMKRVTVDGALLFLLLSRWSYTPRLVMHLSVLLGHLDRSTSLMKAIGTVGIRRRVLCYHGIRWYHRHDPMEVLRAVRQPQKATKCHCGYRMYKEEQDATKTPCSYKGCTDQWRGSVAKGHGYVGII
jgi:hypothetical protein